MTTGLPTGNNLRNWPAPTTAEIAAVEKVMRSGKVNYWTGTEGRAFETEFAAWCGVSHAIALMNGTVALDLCWRTLGIGKGDEVIVTPRTFLASASSIINAGAIPVFADVDRDSQNITPETALRVLTPKSKAILCVHLAGWPCDMTGFQTLAKAHGLALVEDCAQAHGASWLGKSVGAWSDMAAWSFCQDKIMTTGGEGGMVTMHDEKLWSKAWSYKDHGKSWEAVYERQHPPGYRFVHETIGTNWRMLEMQATIGREQLRVMPQWTAARTKNAEAIFDVMRNFSVVRVPEVPSEAVHAYYKAYTFVQPEGLKEGWSRDRIVKELEDLGVPCLQGSCSEIYLEKAFDHAPGRPAKRLPVAKELGETSLMFLVHPTLTDADLDFVRERLGRVLRACQR
jgi:dTDP-4-amino-4,6-dideoxygalactose transaminase